MFSNLSGEKRKKENSIQNMTKMHKRFKFNIFTVRQGQQAKVKTQWLSHLIKKHSIFYVLSASWDGLHDDDIFIVRQGQ